jgi:hypothetical protein
MECGWLILFLLGHVGLRVHISSFIVLRLLSRSWLAAADSLALRYAIMRVVVVQEWLQLNGKHPVWLYRCTVYTNKHSAGDSF